MTELEEEKLKKEIKRIKYGLWIDLFKGVAIVAVPILLFITIQMPESILNKKMSNESINRERAKLVSEVIHNTSDYGNVILELSAIKKAYPDEDNDWINEIINLYQTRIDKIDSTNNAKTRKLLDDKEKLQTQLVSAMSGRNGTNQLKSQINELNDQIIKQLVDEARNMRNPSQADDLYLEAYNKLSISYKDKYNQKKDSITSFSDFNTRINKWNKFFIEIGY